MDQRLRRDAGRVGAVPFFGSAAGVSLDRSVEYSYTFCPFTVRICSGGNQGYATMTYSPICRRPATDEPVDVRDASIMVAPAWVDLMWVSREHEPGRLNVRELVGANTATIDSRHRRTR